MTVLEANAVTAAAHVTADLLALIASVQQAVPASASNARRHARVADKRLEMKEEELGAAVKTLQSFLQQLLVASDDTLEFTTDTLATILRLFEWLTGPTAVSTTLTSAGGNAAQVVAESSRIRNGIDSTRSKVSHAQWLARGEGTSNIVSIAAVDSAGEPVCDISPADLSVTFSSGSTGWSVPLVSVEDNTVKLNLLLTPDCSEDTVMRVNSGVSAFTIPLKVRT